MKIQKNIIAVALANLMICFVVSAQTQNLNVSATVSAGGTSSLTLVSPTNGSTLSFINSTNTNGDGSLLVGDGDGDSSSRFVSTPAQLSYTVASLASGNAWSLKIYTTDVNGEVGLVNGTNTIPLKYNQANGSGVFSSIDPEANWSGDAATYSFVTNVIDDSDTAATDFVDASTIIDSESADAIGFNPNVGIQFGTDVAGAVAGTYTANVVFNLFVD